MNDRARDALAEAAFNGVPQAKGIFMGHAVNMVCGLGALHLAAHEWNWDAARACRGEHHGYPFVVYPCGFIDKYGLSGEECREIIRHNDEDGWDFLTLSRKACLGSNEASEG